MDRKERIDTVNDQLRLIQYPDGNLFGSDALVLAGFVNTTGVEKAAELGCGSGIVSLLCLARNKAKSVDAYEIQPEYADLARRNASLNGYADRMNVVEGDLLLCSRQPENRGRYGMIFTNPPYMPASGKECDDKGRQIARHEICGGVVSFCEAAGRMLRSGGKFFVVCRPDRLTDLLVAMREAAIEPKRLTPVLPSAGRAPCLLLVEGKKDAAPSLIFTAPFHMDGQEYETRMQTGRF